MTVSRADGRFDPGLRGIAWALISSGHLYELYRLLGGHTVQKQGAVLLGPGPCDHPCQGSTPWASPWPHAKINPLHRVCKKRYTGHTCLSSLTLILWSHQDRKPGGDWNCVDADRGGMMLTYQRAHHRGRGGVESCGIITAPTF